MSVQLLKSELEDACLDKGVFFNKDEDTKPQILSKLKKHQMSRVNLKSFKWLREFPSPMLCYPFSEMKKEERRDLLLDDVNWVTEPKYYGCRVFITYFKGEGLRFFSRKLCEETFLPFDITDNVFVRFPKFDLGDENFFILDGMLVSDKIRRKGNGDIYRGMEKTAVNHVLSLPRDESIYMQQKYVRLSVVAFDLLVLGEKEVHKFPLRERRNLLKKLLSDELEGYETGRLPIKIPPQHVGEKIQHFDDYEKEGYEGIVVKNINMPYYPQLDRRSQYMVKIKRGYGSFVDDVDLFISGIFKNKIELSSYFLTKSGIMYEAIVGDVPVPDTIPQTEVPCSDFVGDSLIPISYIGQVVTAKISHFDRVKRRFKYVRVKWTKRPRMDKGRFDCVLTEDVVGTEFLKSVIRGL